VAAPEILPPGMTQEQLAPSEAPAHHAGGFFEQRRGAPELITPTDELSGLPLPILTNEVLPVDNPEKANRHHHWHPSNAPELDVGTLAGAALRRSRIQVVRAVDHNQRRNGKPMYHDFFAGPSLPKTEQEVFKLCVWACAGYIPDSAIDLSGDQPKIVEMNQKQKAILQKIGQPDRIGVRKTIKLRLKAAEAYQSLIDPGVNEEEFADQFVQDYKNIQNRRAGFTFHHFSYGYEPIRNFFRHYTISQPLDHVRENRIEEFLMTNDTNRKSYLGHWLLSKAVEVAIDDLYDTYAEIKKQGNLHPARPVSPRIFLRNSLGMTNQRVELAEQLADSLRHRYRVAA
jgi:hypothetical protein